MIVSELSQPLTSCSTWGSRPCTVELTLVAGMQVSQPQEHECGRAVPATCLPCDDMGKGEMPPPLSPYYLWQAEELAMSLTICST